MAGFGRSERARVRGAQAGSVSDLEALFREHWPRAYRAAYLVVHDAAAAEDIAQEAFLAAVRALDRFDRGRPFAPAHSGPRPRNETSSRPTSLSATTSCFPRWRRSTPITAP
jgi:hypothetical protein